MIEESSSHYVLSLFSMVLRRPVTDNTEEKTCTKTTLHLNCKESTFINQITSVLIATWI